MAEQATHMRQPAALGYAASGAETPAALGTVDIGFDANTWESAPQPNSGTTVSLREAGRTAAPLGAVGLWRGFGGLIVIGIVLSRC